MKNLLITISLLATSCIARAQISLEYTLGPITHSGIILLSDGSTKFYTKDTGVNVLKLYNTDYSVWRTIPLPIPAGGSIATIQYVSDKLFNTDDAIEVFVSYTTFPPTTYTGIVVNESGSVIATIPNGYWATVYYVAGAHKLSVLEMHTSSSPSYQKNSIYSLPGSLPCGHCGAGSVGVPKTANTTGGTPVAMPNPATGSVSIIHGLPMGTTGTLSVVGPDGRTHATQHISGNEPTTTINIANYPQGMYFFTVQNQNGETQSGTFVK